MHFLMRSGKSNEQTAAELQAFGASGNGVSCVARVMGGFGQFQLGLAVLQRGEV